jgi:hypothetical protein
MQIIKMARQVSALYVQQVYEMLPKLITCFGDEMWKETPLSYTEETETEVQAKTVSLKTK